MSSKSDDVFVLTQFHPIRGGAEVVIKRRDRFQVWAGNLVEVDNPNAYYAPGEADDIRAMLARGTREEEK